MQSASLPLFWLTLPPAFLLGFLNLTIIRYLYYIFCNLIFPQFFGTLIAPTTPKYFAVLFKETSTHSLTPHSDPKLKEEKDVPVQVDSQQWVGNENFHSKVSWNSNRWPMDIRVVQRIIAQVQHLCTPECISSMSNLPILGPCVL